MKVYRIEHKETGIGPLCAKQPGYSVPWEVVFRDHNSPYMYGEFEEFSKNYELDKFEEAGIFKFVFGSMCLDWLFKLVKNFEILEEHGFILREFNVNTDYVVLPDGQVIFDREQAQITG